MRNTTQYILKRLLYMIPMVLVITFLIYGGLELTPGDAISHMIPPDQLANVNPEQLEALRESYGLNDPFLLRYVRWLGELLHGNFGYSITSGVPIKDILLQLFPATLELSLAALAISSVLGSILGILSALKKGSIGDNVLTVFGMIGVSIPQFFFGMLCILVFALDWAIHLPYDSAGPACECESGTTGGAAGVLRPQRSLPPALRALAGGTAPR